MAFTMLKIVMLAPMPMASVSSAATKNPGFCREAAPGVKEVAKQSAHGGDHIKPCATKSRRFGPILERYAGWRSTPNSRVRYRTCTVRTYAPYAPGFTAG